MVSICFFHPRESVWYLHAFCPHPKESRHPLWYLHAFVLIQGSQSGVCIVHAFVLIQGIQSAVCMLLYSSKGVSQLSACFLFLSKGVQASSLVSACFCTHPMEPVCCLHAFCPRSRESRHPVWCLRALAPRPRESRHVYICSFPHPREFRLSVQCLYLFVFI